MTFKTTAIIAFLLLGLSLVWQWSHPYSVPAAQGVKPSAIPLPATRQDGALAYILEHNIWDKDRNKLESRLRADGSIGTREESAINAAAAEDDHSWQLLGVSQQGPTPIAIVETVTGIENYEVGDELPNGDRINEIMAFGIQISRLGEDENIYLFGKN